MDLLTVYHKKWFGVDAEISTDSLAEAWLLEEDYWNKTKNTTVNAINLAFSKK